MISILSLVVTCSLADRPPDPALLPLPPEPLRAGFRAIEEADLRAWVGFLASEELEGRETGQRGYDVATRFAASIFERYGLKPAGDGGTYFQEFGVVLSEPDLEASGLEVADASGTERFGVAGHLALSTARDLEWDQRWVFVGSGRGADWDAPDPFGGLPLEDRVVMVLPSPGESRFESRGAVAAGARRIAVVSDGRVKSRLGLSREENAQFLGGVKQPPGPEVVFIGRAAANRILRTRGVTVEALEALPVMPRLDLEGVRVRLSLKRKTTLRSTRNVVGFLEGSDPALRSQVVSVGAHLDHLGTQGGKVFRGADDDASGSSGVLALVKAFAESPRRPSRSLLFCLFTGEEKGLWGSRYFVEHPPVPLERFFCHLQMDMIGRNEELPKEPAGDNTNSLHLVGAERASREVHRAILSANRFVGLDFEYDEEEVLGRSDQIEFVERGVPVAFFFTGFHPDYHQPTDIPDRINYPKLARVLRLIFASAYGLADHPAPLRRIGRR